MMNTIFSNYLYVTAFYFLVLLPFFSLIFLSAFCSFQKKISGLERSLMKCFFYFYAVWCIVSLFATSLSYLLLTTNTGSYYFLTHFFIAVPILSLLSGVVFSGITNKNCIKENLSNLGIFLNSFSLFISFIYMGLKFYLGKG
jgi:hypothetical protein